MEGGPGNGRAVLEGALRLGAEIARLPALPTHDWMDRAAAIIAPISPTGVVITLLGPIGMRTSIERIGAAGPDAGAVDRNSGALMQRIGRLPAPLPGVFVVPLEARLCEAIGPPLDPGAGGLFASAPLMPAGARRISIVGAGASDARAADLLQLGARALAARALAALGPEPRSEAQWLLPADLELIDALVAGKTIPEIARDSGRTPNQVQDAIKALYRRLGRNRRAELVARAVGHIPTEPASEIEPKRADAPDAAGAAGADQGSGPGEAGEPAPGPEG